MIEKSTDFASNIWNRKAASRCTERKENTVTFYLNENEFVLS